MTKKIVEPPGTAGQFFRLVNHAYFEGAITLFIFMNTFVMALKHYQMDPTLVAFSEYANYVFAFVFNVEMILKLIGLRMVYFQFTWNLFDMVIVFATDVGIVLKFMN